MAELLLGVPEFLTDRARAVTTAALASVVLVGLATVISSMAGVGMGIAFLVGAVVVAVGTVTMYSPVVATMLLSAASFARLLLPPTEPAEPSMLLFVALIGSVVLSILRGALPAPRFGGLEAAVVLFLVWNVGSALAAHHYPAYQPRFDEHVSVWRLILIGTLVPFVMYTVGRTVFGRPREVRQLLWLVVAISGASAVMSVLPFAGGEAFVPAYILDTDWPERAVGIVASPVVNGFVMTIGFVAALAVARLTETPRWLRSTAYLVAIASLYGVYLTLTRAAWLAFGVVLVMGIALARGFRAGFVLVGVVTIAAIAANWTTVTSNDRTQGGIGSTGEVDDRLNAIATALWAVAREPLAGWGIGRFTIVNTYHHQQWSPDVKWISGYGITSHHTGSGLAVELGLVGFGLWTVVLVLLGRVVLKAYKILREGDLLEQGMAFIALAGFAAWVVVGETVDLRYNDFANILMLLLIGVAVRMAQVRTRRSASSATTPSPVRVPADRPSTREGCDRSC